MNVAQLTSAQQAIPIETLAKNQTLTEEQKVAEVSRQFEAVLLRQILQQARKPVIDSEFNLDSQGASIYQDMVTNTLADTMSRTGGLGLASSLQAQLSREAISTKTSEGKTKP